MTFLESGGGGEEVTCNKVQMLFTVGLMWCMLVTLHFTYSMMVLYGCELGSYLTCNCHARSSYRCYLGMMCGIAGF
jgi:hypothetical protein